MPQLKRAPTAKLMVSSLPHLCSCWDKKVAVTEQSADSVPAPPPAKKAKTKPAPKTTTEQPEVVDDDEEEAGAEDDEDEEEEAYDDEAELEETPEETAKTGGPAAAAKGAKGKDVPKEDDLEEVDEVLKANDGTSKLAT